MTENLTQLTLVISQVAQAVGVIGIYLLYQQTELGRKATQCQLINELEKEFACYNLIFVKLKPNGEWYERKILSADEIGQLENLASFCEKLEHFRARGVLNWKTLDAMFRNRFFLIMHNRNVCDFVIKPCVGDWEAALRLHEAWRKRLPKSDIRRRMAVLSSDGEDSSEVALELT